jgi:hypothetical protein
MGHSHLHRSWPYDPLTRNSLRLKQTNGWGSDHKPTRNP